MKLFGGYVTPRKYEVFSRLALNSYVYFIFMVAQQIISILVVFGRKFGILGLLAIADMF